MASLRFTTLAVVALSACGKVEPTPADAIDDAPVAAPPDAPPPALVTPPRRSGSISMTSGGGTFRAYADFPLAATRPSARTAECEIAAPSRQAEASESAGEIVIDVPSRTPTSATLAFDTSKKTYESASLEAGGKADRLELPNAPFHIRATGAGIPAFEIDLPSAFDAGIIEPAEGATLSDKTGDLLVRWSDGGNEGVFVILSVLDTSVTCRFPDGAQQGVVPAALVQEARARSSGTKCSGACASIGLMALRRTTVSAGDYDIFVSHAHQTFRPLANE